MSDQNKVHQRISIEQNTHTGTWKLKHSCSDTDTVKQMHKRARGQRARGDTHLNLHVSEPAVGSVTGTCLPQAARDFIAQGSLAVTEWAQCSLKWYTSDGLQWWRCFGGGVRELSRVMRETETDREREREGLFLYPVDHFSYVTYQDNNYTGTPFQKGSPLNIARM